MTTQGLRIGALVCNSVGRATRGLTQHFWAAPYERGGEFGGRGFGPDEMDALTLRLSDLPANTDLAVVATDAPLTKAQVKRVAIMAQDGFALALRPRPCPGRQRRHLRRHHRESRGSAPDLRDLTEIGMLAAECVAPAPSPAASTKQRRSRLLAQSDVEGAVWGIVRFLRQPSPPTSRAPCRGEARIQIR